MFTANLSIFFSFNYYIEAFCFDFWKSFQNFDELLTLNPSKNRLKIEISLLDAIKFQNEIVEHFKWVCSFISSIVFFQLMCGATNIAMPMFLVLWVRISDWNSLLLPINDDFSFKSLQHLSPAVAYYTLLACLLISSVAPYCYRATITMFILKQNSEIVYQSLWYKLTVKQQKSIQFLILFAQKEYEIKGFNFVECSLYTLLRICRISYSLYLIFYDILEK